MNYVTRQLILLLTKVHEAFGKHNAAVDQIRKNSDQQTKIQDEALKKILAAHNESEHNQTVSNSRQYSVHNSTRWAAWCTTAITIGAVGAATWYASITHRMWKEMQTQTCIQREASMNAERAWVGLSSAPVVETSSLQEKTFIAAIKLPLKDFGKGPASNVFANANFSFHGQVDDAIEASCNLLFPFVGLKPTWPVSSNITDFKRQWGTLLFPNTDPFVFEADSNGNSSSLLGKEVFVVGCVVYKDQFQRPHWTKFSYSTGPYVTQVVVNAASFKHLSTSGTNNYTDDAEKKQNCPVTEQ